MNVLRHASKRTARAARLGWLAVLGGALQMGWAAGPAVVPLGSYSEVLQTPARVAADRAGNVYVTDPAADQVAVFDAFGRLLSLRQGLAGPLGIAVDHAGHIWLGEEKTGSVTVFDPQWNQMGKLGQGDGEFALPSHIAVEPGPEGGRVYVSDSKAHRVRVYSSGKLILTFGGFGAGPGQFNFPAGIFVSAGGEVFVVDQNNDRVEVFDYSGSLLRQFSLVTRLGGMGLGSTGGRSQGITGDGSGRLFVADTFQDFVRVFDASGAYLSRIGGLGGALGQFRSPAGLALDGFGRLLVASANNGRVEVIGLDSYIHLAAAPSRPTVAEGSGVTFSVSFGATGPFPCQWRKNGNNLGDGGDVAGATTTTLRLAAVSAGHSGAYSVAVSGPWGTLVSPEAGLTVLAPPTIVESPVAQTVLFGADTAFSVLARGGEPTSYQWKKDGANLNGETNASLVLRQVQDSDAGHYSVAVANPVGAADSDAVLLAVNHPPQVNLGSLQVSPPAGARVSMSDVLAANPDSDGDAVVLTAVNPGSVAGGTVLWDGDWLFYTPPPGYTNADLVSYTVSDGHGGVSTGRLLVEPPGTSAQTRVLALQTLEGGRVQVLFAGIPGLTYTVQSCDDLETSDWQTLTNLTADASGLYRLLDAPPSSTPSRFYRSQW